MTADPLPDQRTARNAWQVLIIAGPSALSMLQSATILSAVRYAQKTVRSAQNADQSRGHAIRAARAFNRACQLTGLSSAELCRRLPPMIGKQNVLSRQTLAAWRKGWQSVPLVAFLAACDLADLRPPLIFALAAEESTQA